MVVKAKWADGSVGLLFAACTLDLLGPGPVHAQMVADGYHATVLRRTCTHLPFSAVPVLTSQGDDDSVVGVQVVHAIRYDVVALDAEVLLLVPQMLPTTTGQVEGSLLRRA